MEEAGMVDGCTQAAFLYHGKAVECYRKAGLKAESGATRNLHMRDSLDLAKGCARSLYSVSTSRFSSDA